MKDQPKSRPSIVYLYSRPIATLVSEVAAGKEPSERLYNLHELRQRGRSVDHHSGPDESSLTGRIMRSFGRFVRLMGPGTIRAIGSHDITIVKGEFSTLRTLTARLLGKRIIYLDAMFGLPNRFWRRWSAKWNLRWADRTVAYSKTQADLWAQSFCVSRSKVSVIPFGMDIEFYQPVERAPRDYVLAVGRDLGRDYATLLEALAGTGIRLKLVTLPYLLPDGAAQLPMVDILERVTYEELFQLYGGALGSVIPLKAGVTYPSGIRALYEAGLLGVPSVASRTPVLEEAFAHGKDIWFVPPEDPDALREALIDLRRDPDRFAEIASAAQRKVCDEYSTDRAADALEMILRGATPGSA